MSTPPASARSTHRRAYAGPLRTRRRVPQAEPGVLAQARGPARLVLPVEDDDGPRATRSQCSGGGQAGGAGADDQRVDRLDRATHGFTARPSWRATAAPQKKP